MVSLRYGLVDASSISMIPQRPYRIQHKHAPVGHVCANAYASLNCLWTFYYILYEDRLQLKHNWYLIYTFWKCIYRLFYLNSPDSVCVPLDSSNLAWQIQQAVSGLINPTQAFHPLEFFSQSCILLNLNRPQGLNLHLKIMNSYYRFNTKYSKIDTERSLIICHSSNSMVQLRHMHFRIRIDVWENRQCLDWEMKNFYILEMLRLLMQGKLGWLLNEVRLTRSGTTCL